MKRRDLSRRDLSRSRVPSLPRRLLGVLGDAWLFFLLCLDANREARRARDARRAGYGDEDLPGGGAW